MTKYEFGAGYSKYELTAVNDDIAYLTIVMFVGHSNLPIAIYKPQQKIIIGKEIIDMDDLFLFIRENRKDLKKARLSIKKIL